MELWYKLLEYGAFVLIAFYLIHFMATRIVKALDSITHVLGEMSKTLVALQVRMDVVEDKLGIIRKGD